MNRAFVIWSESDGRIVRHTVTPKNIEDIVVDTGQKVLEIPIATKISTSFHSVNPQTEELVTNFPEEN